jgi:hypothetical protein
MSDEQEIRMEEYSERSFCVRGPTKPHKTRLAELGGKWNTNLKGGETGRTGGGSRGSRTRTRSRDQ